MIIDGVRINYGVYDQTIDDDTVTENVSGNSAYSNPSNSLSEAEKQKITYLEKDYFLLDGSHAFPETGNTYNVGWESANLSDASGNISEYIEYIFGNTHNSYGVQIIFPPYCAPKSFTLQYFNGSTSVGVVNVTNNTSTNYSNNDMRLNWNKVRLT